MGNERKHIPDMRSYAFHQKASEILKADPARLMDVYQTLEHWRTVEGSQAQGWAIKWADLIKKKSVSEISELILRRDEQMDFYRKSSPFPCLLSDEDRLEIIGNYKYD